MKTGFRGTFVISWGQTELDGYHAAPVAALFAGATWRWTGAAVRVDGPNTVLPLGDAIDSADLRRRAGSSIRRLFRRTGDEVARPDAVPLMRPLFDDTFTVTDGRTTWDVALVPGGAGRKPLLMFHSDIPPREEDLWVVSTQIAKATLTEAERDPGGVVCFTPGTMIATPWGDRDIAALMPGDLVQTQDNGAVPIDWIGRRDVTGARLMISPELTPVRLRRHALGHDVPDQGLLVSPDHRILVRGPQARALFSADEVLVAARDLVNDRTVIRDRAIRKVQYIHMMLPRHDIVFANGVPTESFHPASAAVATLRGASDDVGALPFANDPSAYGAFARRVLSPSEAAILHHD